MVNQPPVRRVALMVNLPSSLEEEVAMGALDFAEHVGRWEIVSSGERPFVTFDQIDLSKIDGLIGRFHTDRDWDEAVRRAGVPAVNAASPGPGIDLPHVGVSDEVIGRMGAAYLLERGFTDFGFISVAGLEYTRARLAGFRQVIVDDAGRQCHECILSGDGDQRHRARVDWLAELPKPVAIMAPYDFLGRRLIRAAVDMGLRIPEDVAVLGVDNDRWHAAIGKPPMSSIEIDARQIGYQAAKMLDEIMAGYAPTPMQLLDPVGVVTRQSTDIMMMHDALVTEALGFIRDHYAEGITVEDVLAKLGVSRTTLEQRMRKSVGCTPHVAICRARVERAKQLLTNSHESMQEIAVACGFHCQPRLNEVFKRLTGMTPSQYRQQRRA